MCSATCFIGDMEGLLVLLALNFVVVVLTDTATDRAAICR